MSSKYVPLNKPIVEPNYFSNWVDLFMPKIANKLIPLVAQFDLITPNILTLTSSLVHLIGSCLLFLNLPFHLYLAALFLPLSYILDCMDGQLARTKHLSSELGNYLDKTLDVLKIYIIHICLSIAVYQESGNVLWIFAGFTSCFFFLFRYYIKLETVNAEVSKDKLYLEKSRDLRWELYAKYEDKHRGLRQTFFGFLKSLWLKNRIIFFIDEGEFILFASIGAIFNRLDIVLLVFTVSNVWIGFFRLYERGYQTLTGSNSLLLPMRK